MTETHVILGACMTPRCPIPEHLRLSEEYRLQIQLGV